MPEGSGQELTWRDGNLTRNSLYCLPADSVGLRYLQLCRLFDDNQAFMLGNMVQERLHQGCLPAAGSAADDAVLSIDHQLDDDIPHADGQTAGRDQLIRRKPVIEFADRHGDAVDGRWRSDDGNARPVREPIQPAPQPSTPAPKSAPKSPGIAS